MPSIIPLLLHVSMWSPIRPIFPRTDLFRYFPIHSPTHQSVSPFTHLLGQLFMFPGAIPLSNFPYSNSFICRVVILPFIPAPVHSPPIIHLFVCVFPHLLIHLSTLSSTHRCFRPSTHISVFELSSIRVSVHIFTHPATLLILSVLPSSNHSAIQSLIQIVLIHAFIPSIVHELIFPTIYLICSFVECVQLFGDSLSNRPVR
jgi:hypothetical protein